MSRIFESYLKGKQSGQQTAGNAFAMRQAVEGIKRQGQMRNILSEAYTPEQEGPMQPGVERIPASFDRAGAANALMGGGFIREAQQVASPFGAAAPSAVREYEFYKGLPTEAAKEQYLAVKRAQQIKDIAGVPTTIPQVVGAEAVPLSTLEEEAAAKSRLAAAQRTGAITGEAVTTAQLNLPKMESSAEELLDLTEKLLKHPGKKYAIGMASKLPVVPGTDQAGFVTMYNQIGGKQFMEAYQTLKGGGQITEVEGQKATEAMARMNRAQNQRDFDQGVKDFQEVIKSGLSRARGAAGQKPAKAGPKVGAIQNGYVFMGGDPANPASWKKQ